jgi:hypothetical protein
MPKLDKEHHATDIHQPQALLLLTLLAAGRVLGGSMLVQG